MRFFVCASEITPCPQESMTWVSMAEIMDLAQLGIDAESILYVMSWGFAWVVGCYFLGWGIALAKSLISKL